MFAVPLFIIALPPPPGAVFAASWGNGNGVDCRLFRCGSTKSNLLPCVRSAAGLSCDVEFLKMASSFACIAHELSAWSLLIVFILVAKLPNWLFTASNRLLHFLHVFFDVLASLSIGGIYLVRHLLKFFLCRSRQIEIVVQVLMFVVS